MKGLTSVFIVLVGTCRRTTWYEYMRVSTYSEGQFDHFSSTTTDS